MASHGVPYQSASSTGCFTRAGESKTRCSRQRPLGVHERASSSLPHLRHELCLAEIPPSNSDRRTRAEAVLHSGEASYQLIGKIIPALIATMTAEVKSSTSTGNCTSTSGRRSKNSSNGATSDAVHPDNLPQVIDAWGGHALSDGLPVQIDTACAALTVCTAGFMSAACRFATKKGVSPLGGTS